MLIATIVQAAKRNKVYKQIGFTRTQALKNRPQIKGVVSKIATMSPKKPNSAVRHVAKVKLTSKLRITGRLPGQGYYCSKYNRVLVEGGRANDLPGVGYTLVRGAFDFSPVVGKRKRRSVYGVARPDDQKKYVRKCFRTLQS